MGSRHFPIGHLTETQKKRIIDKFSERKVVIQCPMCRNSSFILADGFFNNIMQFNNVNLQLGGPSIPTIPIVCANCGFVSQHSLGALGLLDLIE